MRPTFADNLLTLLIAEPGKSERAKDAVRLLSTITLTAVVAILGIGLVSVLLIRRHRRRLAGIEGGRKKRRPPPDPWFESGRRVPEPEGPGPKSRIIRLPGSDDDTVDIDPEDLEADDVEGDDPDDQSPGSRGG